MPLTLTITEGALPKGSEKLAYSRCAQAMLKWHGLTGNKVMTPNVIGHVTLVNSDNTFSGTSQAPVAFVEWKVPGFAFTSRDAQLGYVDEVTNIIHEMSDGKLPKDHIWVNVVHAVDGGWGINGVAMTNDELKQAISSG